MDRITYAIGDIHGDLAQLRHAHRKVVVDMADHAVSAHQIVHVGDLVDRRADSKGVIDHLISGHAEGAPWVTLKGNHDRLFHWFMETPRRADPRLRSDYNWLHPRMGGRDTLASYGVSVPEKYDIARLHAEAIAAVPRTHVDFLKALPLCYETEHFYFAHAGIRPRVALEDQKEDDLVWIRDEFLTYEQPHPKIIVHGHTPVDEVMHCGNRINIDTGAAWGGPLSTIAIVGSEVFLLTDDGRVPLTPHGGLGH